MIWETIKIRAKTHGDKTAIICHDKSYTYKELIDSVEKLSAILSTAMLPGDKVLFASDKEYHYVRMVLACDSLWDLVSFGTFAVQCTYLVFF